MLVAPLRSSRVAVSHVPTRPPSTFTPPPFVLSRAAGTLPGDSEPNVRHQRCTISPARRLQTALRSSRNRSEAPANSHQVWDAARQGRTAPGPVGTRGTLAREPFAGFVCTARGLCPRGVHLHARSVCMQGPSACRVGGHASPSWRSSSWLRSMFRRRWISSSASSSSCSNGSSCNRYDGYDGYGGYVESPAPPAPPPAVTVAAAVAAVAADE